MEELSPEDEKNLEDLLDRERAVPEVLTKEMGDSFENDYMNLLKSPHVGTAITNISEYLLMTQAMKGEVKAAAIWFKLGLKYFEDKNVD